MFKKLLFKILGKKVVKDFKFENEITIKGRINDIKLTCVDKKDGYLPGKYFTTYLYVDGHGNYYWMDVDTLVSQPINSKVQLNNQRGWIWSDWQIIPKDVIKMLKFKI